MSPRRATILTSRCPAWPPAAKLAGVWLQVSLVVLGVIAVPVIGAWCATGAVLRALGVDARVASLAAEYALVLAACVPARVGLSQLGQYFQAQKIMWPSVCCAAVAFSLNLQVVVARTVV